MKQPPARQLSFDSLQEAVTDAKRLREAGYRATGQWDLVGVLKHCEIWLAAAFKQPIKPPLIARPIFWIVQRTAGPTMLRKLLEEGTMSPGIPTAKQTTFTNQNRSSDREEEMAIESLEQTVRHFENYQGEIHASPFFGKMDKASADHLHRIHLAHHLGYLVPNDSAD